MFPDHVALCDVVACPPQVIKRIPGARYVVAPYEADAQLGFLARNGHVDAVITEDSDIILFGCTRVVFKLDRDGTGQEVDLREVFSRRCGLGEGGGEGWHGLLRGEGDEMV